MGTEGFSKVGVGGKQTVEQWQQKKKKKKKNTEKMFKSQRCQR